MSLPPEPARVEVPLGRACRLINASPVLLLSTHDGVRANACPVAWYAPVRRDPPQLVLALDPDHKTSANLRASGLLGLNVPTPAQLELVRYCGSCSGHDVDKVAARGIALFAASALPGLPLLADCAAWLECRRLEATGLADHDLVLVQAVAAWARPGVLDAEGCWDAARFPTLHHAGGQRFLQGRPLASSPP
jgi:flavin reductase (DIM6/NTAB) family NADH-FMN oxidoreductase RutF